MKKFLLLLLVLLLSLSLLQANSQEYYTVSSALWQTVNQLCHTAGVAGPSSNGPVTADQILVALERASSVLGEDDEVVSWCMKKLKGDVVLYKDDNGTINFYGEIAPEIYLQTNRPFGSDNRTLPEYDIDGDWFIKNNRETNAPISVTLENSLGSILYTRFVLEVEQGISRQNDANLIWNKYYHSQFFEADIFRNFPRDAGISIGTGGLNLIVARSGVSHGEGYTGNTGIGDNFDYQEFMKAGFYTGRTSVFINLTSFDSSHQSFIDGTPLYEDLLEPWGLLSSRFSGYRELRHSVVYEITPFDNLKISGAFITLLDTDSAFDLRLLNPFMIVHNYFNYKEETILEANNLVTIDISWAVAKKWNLYAQVTMDQIQLASEVKTDLGEKGLGYIAPNAFGALMNVSYSDIIGKGIMNIYLESVYNMPGMYLNTKYYDGNGNVSNYKNKGYEYRCFSQDYLVGYKRTESDYDDIAYGGYIYGPDCLVFALGGTYRIPDFLSLSASTLYMAHGEKGRGSNPSNYTFDGIDVNSLDEIDRLSALSLYGTIEHTLVVKAEGEVKVWNYISLSLGAAYSYRWNYRNISGLRFGNLQAYVGFRISSGGVEV